ncbi:methyltransferase [Propionicicella superfundia]|uniref:methyltransferase n=1 Tax=Propionicicella superfundia TaxID=348582 RepID=UPI0003F7B90F|nr:methyltransferase [Propionicicella superfundia]
MFLSVTLTGPHAPDLGFLLHKHPGRVQTFDLAAGRATVLYPVDEPGESTCALLLDIDPIALVRGKRFRSESGLLDQYVNDRPYAASSLVSVALGRVFRSALNGECPARPGLADRALPLTVRIPCVPVRTHRDASADAQVRALFEPLGWTVDARSVPLAPGLDWGDAPYVDLTLSGEQRLADALSHVYVLLPVLDNAKHYWVGSDEVEKLLRRAEAWLPAPPARDLIPRRYLAFRREFVADATARLDALDGAVPDTAGAAADTGDGALPEPADETGPAGETVAAGEVAPAVPSMPETGSADVAGRPPLAARRAEAVLNTLHEVDARRVVDLGCGEGHYLRRLIADPHFTEILGVDVSPRALATAERRLRLHRLSDRQRARLTLRQSSATYRDDGLAGYDAILLVEVIEHIPPDRLESVAANVFGAARPSHVVVTTPNVEYNAVYGLPEGRLRHADHRFEWTRAEFAAWAAAVADVHGYDVELRGVGDVDPDRGAPTQLAVFGRRAA